MAWLKWYNIILHTFLVGYNTYMLHNDDSQTWYHTYIKT